MNKTISMNLARQNYFFDEDAYTLMNQYLTNLKFRFEGTKGASEMLEDIEIRITEIINEKKMYDNQVVSLDEVNSIISQLGSIEDYDTEETTSSNSSIETYDADAQFKKKLYSDPDDTIVGGVLSGISKYFGWKDSLWIRLAFVLIVIFDNEIYLDGLGEFLVVSYIVLLVLLPKAKSRIDKMKMKGKPITIQEIEKTYIEEKNSGSYASGSHSNSTSTKVTGFLGEIGEVIVKLVKGLGKFFLLFFGIVITFVLLAMFWAFTGLSNSGFSFQEFAGKGNEWYVYLTYYGLMFLIAIPIIALVIYIIKELFKLKIETHWIKLMGLILWIVSLFSVLLGSSRISKLFSTSNKAEEKQAIYSVPGQAYYLNYEGLEDEEGIGPTINMGNFKYFGENIIYDNVTFDIEKSPNDSIYMKVKKKASGKNKDDAYNNAQEIKYKFLQNDTLITIKPDFTLENPIKFRNQKVDLVLMLPVGKTVYLNKNMKKIINDIDNTTDTWDGDMVNKYWTMTPNGLKNELLEKENNEENENEKNETSKSKSKDVKVDKKGNDITITIKDENSNTTDTVKIK